MLAAPQGVSDQRMRISQHNEAVPQEATPPVSVSHFVNTIREYMPVILLSLLAVMTAYSIVALALYLASPRERVTELNFRLDFDGATKGEYPNGLKFSPTEIVAAPILLKVYEANELAQSLTFPKFRNSIFILEANAAYEALLAEYGGRLSDPKINAVDRERIQQEFELKRNSLSRNDYSINYRSVGKAELSDRTVAKVLNDVLTAWADRAVREQQVGAYRVSVLSPSVIDPTAVETADPVAAVQILRNKITQVILNTHEMANIPSVELIRTARERMSLDEIRLRLEDIVRFQLEPIVLEARDSSGANTAATIQFLESQLSYDQRRLAAKQEHINAIRDSLALYSNGSKDPASRGTSSSSPSPAGANEGEGTETVMPQISDTFLDRLMSLTRNAADSEYREKLVDELRMATTEAIPLEEAVSYDHRILTQMRAGPSGTSKDPSTVQVRLTRTRAEVKALVIAINEIYRSASAHLTPSTQLYSAGTSVTRNVRTPNPSRLAVWGLLVFLIAVPVIIIFCLLHKRVREEEEQELLDTTEAA